MIKDLILKNRSYRRFDARAALEEQTLRELVDLARQSGSAANMQPLRYILSWQAKRNALIFQHLRWAGYLEDWDGPVENERPTGYIIILAEAGNKFVNFDAGIACQSMLLGATERGLGGCMFGSIDREELQRKLAIPAEFSIVLIVALGKPVEKVVLEEVGPDGSIKYWRDEQAVHHVPKRKLDHIIMDL
ncbi:MAG: nitroreductase [Phycisphaerae bacterium SM23_30]|nr:MAG: nitroreductase [Phycisphaerae bacterium SM23_30]